jgi:DNA-binding response OmpR family regulator
LRRILLTREWERADKSLPFVSLSFDGPDDLRRIRMSRPERYRVYVVEDSPLVLPRLLELVRDVGASVVGYCDRADVAIAEIVERKPDAIIVDLMLQGGTGFDVVHEIALEELPVVTMILTNFTAPALKKRAAELGAAYFFDKVSEIPQMMRALNELVEKHQRQVSGDGDVPSTARGEGVDGVRLLTQT